MTKQISESTALQARALFIMAQAKYRESKQFEEQLAALLDHGDEWNYMGVLSDELYNDNGNFDKGLKAEGFTVKPKTKRR